jgi:hypothetical protein
MIGQDSRGNWVIQDQSGTRGGLFVDRAEALKFARSENGNQPHAIVIVDGIFELDTTSGPAILAQLTENTQHERRVA